MKKLTKCILVGLVTLIMSGADCNAMTVTYTDMGVPNVDSSFKTYMPYTAITNKASAQYKFIKAYGWCDNNGFMRCSGERDLGINDDYYLVALGSYYGSTMGTKYRFTTSTGKVFYGALADQKANIHTNSSHQYTLKNKDVIEFLVNSKRLMKSVRRAGSAGAYEPLSGSIVRIEKMEFNADSPVAYTDVTEEQQSKKDTLKMCLRLNNSYDLINIFKQLSFGGYNGKDSSYRSKLFEETI